MERCAARHRRRHRRDVNSRVVVAGVAGVVQRPMQGGTALARVRDHRVWMHMDTDLCVECLQFTRKRLNTMHNELIPRGDLLVNHPAAECELAAYNADPVRQLELQIAKLEHVLTGKRELLAELKAQPEVSRLLRLIRENGL
jgi:hypothetical protein